MSSIALPPINNRSSKAAVVSNASTAASDKKFDSPSHGTVTYDEDGRRAYPSPPNKKLPSFTEAYMSSPSTAGIPVLEIVRRLEEEKALRKEDREALNEAFYDSTRREKIIAILGDIELGVNPKFAIKRLRALIHGNMGGEISSSKVVKKSKELSAAVGFPTSEIMSLSSARIESEREKLEPNAISEAVTEVASARPMEPAPPSGLPIGSNHSNARSVTNSVSGKAAQNVASQDDSVAQSFTQLAVERVVGQAPLYSGPDNFHALSKCVRNYKYFLQKRGAQNKLGNVKFAIIVGTGSFNPLTRMHMRTFFLAKEYLESRCGFYVLGSLLSPAHAATVRERYRTDVTEVIPAPHRVAIAQLMVEESRHLAIDPWEITRRRAMDYVSLLQHTSGMVKSEFSADIDIKILYLCKANMVPKLSPAALKAEGFGCVCVCRAPNSDNLRESLSSKWSGLIWIVEDTAILDASFDLVTSRRVRDNIKAGNSVEGLVGKRVQDYIKNERLGAKMNRLEEWGDSEKALPKIESRRPAT